VRLSALVLIGELGLHCKILPSGPGLPSLINAVASLTSGKAGTPPALRVAACSALACLAGATDTAEDRSCHEALFVLVQSLLGKLSLLITMPGGFGCGGPQATIFKMWHQVHQVVELVHMPTTTLHLQGKQALGCPDRTGCMDQS
jgi:hypothetical protein